MNVKYAKYDGSGRILFCGEVPDYMIGMQGANVYVGEANPQTNYVLLGDLHIRPEFAKYSGKAEVKADGTDECVIPQVPAGTEVRVSGPMQMSGVTDKDGDVVLTFAIAGQYTITMSKFPYQDAKVSFHAV